MKQCIVLCVACLFAVSAFAQEFKFYLNGSNVEDSTFETFQRGDLMRVVFSGKTTPYKFRIANVMVTLTPRGGSNEAFSGNPTSFVLDNTSKEFSNYPTFTIDLFESLALLRHQDYDLTIKVHQLVADTEQGKGWILDHVVFKEVTVRRNSKGLAKN